MNKRMRSMIFYIVLLLVATSGISAFVILVTQGESIQKWVCHLCWIITGD